MDKLKVIFCGTPTIGATILEKLAKMAEVEVVLVVSQPDRLVGRKKILTPTPVKIIANKYQLPIIQPIKIGQELETIKTVKPDFLITCAYGQFIPSSILAIPKIDAINLHGSLLPKYRGGAPIQYAILNGEHETGMTIMRMVKQMDAGDYYCQKAISINDDDNTGTMFEKLAILGAELLEENLVKISQGKLIPIVQDKTEVTFSPNISFDQERIDWTKTDRQVYNQIRSLQPWPIPHTFLNGQRYKIGKTRLIREDENFPITLMIHQPGEIVYIDHEGFVVQTGQGYLKILEIQRPGKQMIDAGQIINGHFTDIRHGACFDVLL